MSDVALAPSQSPEEAPRRAGPRLDHGMHAGGVIAFLLVLAAGLGYAAYSLHTRT